MIVLGHIAVDRGDRRRAGGNLFGATLFGLALVLGPTVGGQIVEHFSWRWIFLVNLPLGGVAWLIAWRAMHFPLPRGDGSLDLPGAALLALTAGGAVARLPVGRPALRLELAADHRDRRWRRDLRRAVAAAPAAGRRSAVSPTRPEPAHRAGRLRVAAADRDGGRRRHRLSHVRAATAAPHLAGGHRSATAADGRRAADRRPRRRVVARSRDGALMAGCGRVR